MEVENRPTWLTIQENGVVGEARTRAFLVDRFWVLERSVDIEGADFIVERRLTHTSLLDRVAPRLGFVQAKYFKDSATAQYVHTAYVLDPELNPRPEFFLVCHTGSEDDARTFLLSSSEIAENFKKTDDSHSHPGRFYLPGKSVLIQRFEVLDRGRSLDRIENALRSADFRANRSFLSWAMPNLAGDRPPINHMYQELIYNNWGDIPDWFERAREAAGRAQWNLRDVLGQLHEMEISDDPAHLLDIANELRREWGGEVSFKINDIYDENFHNVVRYHKQRYEELENSGLLGAHSMLRRATSEHVVKNLAPIMPLDGDKAIIVSVRYQAETMLEPSFESQLKPEAELWSNPPDDRRLVWWEGNSESAGVLDSNPGKIDVYIAPMHFYPQRYGGHGRLETGSSLSDRVGPIAETVARIVSEEALRLRFGSWI